MKKIKYEIDFRVCPYCKGQTKIVLANEPLPFVPAYYGMNVLICSNYPECQAYLYFDDVHLDNPGMVADFYLRKLRVKTHNFIDILWMTKMMSRKEMYEYLSRKLKIEQKFCHVSCFGIEECVTAVMYAIDYIEQHFIEMKTYAQLSLPQIEMLKKIMQRDSNNGIISYKYTNADLKDIFSLIYNDDETRIRQVKAVDVKIKKFCSFNLNSEFYTVYITGEKTTELLKSFAREHYNLWLSVTDKK